jgi:hypothetical protein
MTRVHDLAPPAVTPHPRPPDSPAAAWPGQVVIALERLPQAAYVWDDDDPAVVWDAATPAVVFDNTPNTDANADGIADGWVAYIAGTVNAAARTVVATGQRIVAAPAAGGAYGIDRSPRPAIAGGRTHTVAVTYVGARTLAATAQLFVQGFTATAATGGAVSFSLPDAATVTTASTPITVPADATALRILIRILPTGAPNPAQPMTLEVRRVTITDPAGTPTYVWDAPEIGAGMTDVWCDFHGLEIGHGEPDEHELYPPARAVLALRDPGDGRYRKRTADGRLVYWAVGRRLAVWWHDAAGADWWLFSGRVATWREALDHTVTIEAFSRAATLSQDAGTDWTAGVAAQHTRDRLAAIITAAGSGAVLSAGGDDGDTALSVPPPEDRPAWEAMQQAAWSDGGIVYDDADDTVVYRDRRWRNGRADQTVVPVLSDNVCDAGVVVVWEPEATDADDGVAGSVALTNLTAVTVTATAPGGDPAMRYTHPDVDVWTATVAGQALADWIVQVRSTARMALALARLYLHDRRFDLFRVGADLRLGDRVVWLRRDDWLDGSTDTLQLGLVVRTVRHAITPETWVVDLETSPAVDHVPLVLWDRTAFTWDDPNPANVWS